MAGTLVKRRARSSARGPLAPATDADEDFVVAPSAFAPVLVKEEVTVQGWYLRQAVVAPALHRNGDLFLLLEH